MSEEDTKVELDNLITEDNEQVLPKPVEDEPVNEPEPTDTDKSGEKWDKERQQRDENAAGIKKLGESFTGLNDTVSSMSDKIIGKVKEMLTDSAKKPDEDTGNVDLIAKIEAEVAGMDDDIVEPSVKSAISSLVVALKDSRGKNVNLEKQLADTIANEKSRSEREAQSKAQIQANKDVSDKIASLEVKLVGGKKYLTNDAIRYMQNLIKESHPTPEGEPAYVPTAGEVKEALVEGFYAMKDKFEQKKREPTIDDTFDLDNLKGGSVVDGRKQNLTMDEYIREQRST